MEKLLTAKSSRELSEAWFEKEVNSCGSTILAKIEEAAARGFISLEIYVSDSRPEKFYIQLQDFFEKLGYVVKAPFYNGSTTTKSIWEFKW